MASLPFVLVNSRVGIENTIVKDGRAFHSLDLETDLGYISRVGDGDAEGTGHKAGNNPFVETGLFAPFVFAEEEASDLKDRRISRTGSKRPILSEAKMSCLWTPGAIPL